MNIAICVIAYNRLDSLKRCISFLEKADYPEPVKLYISVDKSKTTIVEDFAKAYHWENGEYEAILHEKNLGLRNHILGCGDLLEKHDALIVLEDDIVVSQSYFCYAKACVEKYHDNMEIAGISLYSFPFNLMCGKPFRPMPSDSDVYLNQNAMSWGEVWMKNQWADFKHWYERHQDDDFYANPALPRRICRWKKSWLKYHTAYCIMENKYFIHPYSSYTTSFSEVGVHAVVTSNKTQTHLMHGTKTDFKLTPSVRYDAYFENEAIYEALGLKKEELCLDFWGLKNNRLNKHYWLTTEELPYKILDSFTLQMRPYEWNILADLKGDEIYLYDTSVKAPVVKRKHRTDMYRYLHGVKEDRIKVWQRKIYKILGKTIKED